MNDKLSYTELLRASKTASAAAAGVKLAIAGDSSTQHLATAVRGYGALTGFRVEVYDAGYRQQAAEILDAQSELYRFGPDFVFLFISAQALYEAFTGLETQERKCFADRKASEYGNLIETLLRHHCKCLINTVPEYNDMVYGSYGAKLPSSFIFQLRKLNLALMQMASESPGVFAVDLEYVAAQMGRERFFDDAMYARAGLAVSVNAIPYVARAIVDVLAASAGRVKKCVILDLDNTLWGGVIGEDGIENIQIGDLGAGKAYAEFQRWLLELKKRGILLAVVSKNDDEVARQPFTSHPDMRLHLDDFVAFIANWDSKADNIKALQERLGIGMDSMVFIDDSPFERQNVRSFIADIEVPEMPEDPAQYVPFLSGLNLFETASASEEDGNRTRQYQEESHRKESQSTYATYDEYLASLQMRASVYAFDDMRIPRIAQLSQRSNQFNLRTVRLSEDDIRGMLSDGRHICRCFELKDAFGDYGLVGYIILDRCDDCLFISSLVLSCRILQRTMEAFVMNVIAEIASREGAERIVGEYIPTAKNVLVKDLYSKLGFTQQEQGRWVLEMSDYVKRNTFIGRSDDDER